ncbi:MAG: nicotinamidase [Bacteroidales bacterium]|jgi:nicotinamidase/pyrazinamidase|nr:nicotinamidase [Bacteroidales bacterium]
MDALLIVDVQNDFCPGGALAAPRGDEVVPVINQLMPEFSVIVASKDWHPEDSVHFNKWPLHCVQHTRGAGFHPGLKDESIHQVFLKGTSGKDDGYSAFEATNENLKNYLQERNVDKLYIAGLTTEYCILDTALNAVKEGFTTCVITDAIRPVNMNEGDEEKALQKMKDAGIHLVRSDDL